MSISRKLSIEFGVPVYYFDFYGVSEADLILTTKEGTEHYCGTFTREEGKKKMKEIGALILSDTDCYMYYIVARPDLLSKASIALHANLEKEFGGKFSYHPPPVPDSPQPPSELPTIQLVRSEPVILVNNYGPRSHALFNVTPALGKELAYYSAVRTSELFSYNKSLTRDGRKIPGWVIRDKNALQEVKNLLFSLSVYYVSD